MSSVVVRRKVPRLSLGTGIRWSLIVMISAVVLMPLADLVLGSFETYRQYVVGAVPRPATLGNFATLWASEGSLLARWLVNSLVVSGAVTLLTLLTVVPAAYVFAKHSSRWHNVIYGVVLFTFFIPFETTLVPLYQMFNGWSLMNSYPALILPYVGSAFGLFLLRQLMLSFPVELLDAARVDGAAPWRTLRSIVVPNVKPAIVTVGLLTFINTWNDYFWPSLVTTSGNMRTAVVGLATLLSANFQFPGPILVSALIAGGPLVVMFVVFQRQITDAIVRSGLQG